MPFWESKSKFSGRVFAILCIRPATDKDETRHLNPTNDLAGRGPRSRPLLIPTSGLTSTYTGPTIAQDLGVRTSDDYADTNHSVSILSGARDVSLTGGNFYAVGGNLTVHRTGKQTIVFYYRNRAKADIYRTPGNYGDGWASCMCFVPILKLRNLLLKL